MDRIEIRKDTYFDSVFLMAASAELARVEGLVAGHLVLATEQNRQLLAAQAFDASALEGLGATDLVIALRADAQQVLDAALGRVETLLQRAQTAAAAGGPTAEPPVGLEGGLAQLPDANLALISVPGAYAAFEARKALARGLNVMLFSNNVPIEEEVALKKRAAELGLLVMGPDCGTAIVGGMPLGFANRVRRGPVGLVGASGTGLQEVTSLLHQMGSGVTQVLGTGGRDLKAGVDARTTLAGLELLADDPDTEVLVVVSKPPAKEVADRVMARLLRLDKPSVVCFLGQESDDVDATARHVHRVSTLAETAWMAHRIARKETVVTTQPYDVVRMDESLLVGTMTEEQRHLHGLFTGGTLGGEALLILRRELGAERVFSNLSAPDAGPPGHTVLDLGGDEYTRGRPHPMIDPTPRNEQIVERGGDPQTAVLVLDVVLGHGSHPDPGGEAARAVAEAKAKNRTLVVIASITGTDLDPQNLMVQQQALADAGVEILPNNAAAAGFAARLVHALEEARQ